MKWTFRHLLALFTQASILVFWSLQGVGLLQAVPGEVNGALISAFTLVTQFYFRKKGPSEEESGGGEA